MARIQDPSMEKRDAEQEPDVLVEDEDDQPGRDVIIMFAVFFEGGLAPLSLFLGWWLGHSPLLRFSWDVAGALWGLVGSLPLLLFFWVMLRRPVGGLRKIKSFFEEEFIPLLAGCSWSDMALIALSAGVGEEMLFRGVLQPSLAAKVGVGWGLALASILFGLLHPISIPYIYATIAVGLYLGAQFLITGNLLAVMVTHALYDFILMAYLLRVHRPAGPITNPIFPVHSDQEIDHYDES
jgi:membrane protease YdiL (CAAX protease family)